MAAERVGEGDVCAVHFGIEKLAYLARFSHSSFTDIYHHGHGRHKCISTCFTLAAAKAYHLLRSWWGRRWLLLLVLLLLLLPHRLRIICRGHRHHLLELHRGKPGVDYTTTATTTCPILHTPLLMLLRNTTLSTHEPWLHSHHHVWIHARHHTSVLAKVEAGLTTVHSRMEGVATHHLLGHLLMRLLRLIGLRRGLRVDSLVIRSLMLCEFRSRS